MYKKTQYSGDYLFDQYILKMYIFTDAVTNTL